MAGKTLDLKNLLVEDNLGTEIARKYIEWDTLRQNKVAMWEEVRRYVFATDTRSTTNEKLPWKNTTTIPKLCQIRDNLYANYILALFPKRKWLEWLPYNAESDTKAKKDAIIQYMDHVIQSDVFKDEFDRLVLDYIDYGNAFATAEWLDETILLPDGTTKTGYIGPVPVRISPTDIVFNPTSPTFEKSPKIVRSLMSVGECKKYLQNIAYAGENEKYENIWKYFKNLRDEVHGYTGIADTIKDAIYTIQGFDSFKSYLDSDYIELLTFQGDMYDRENDEFYENHVIVVIDRHKVVYNKPNENMFGKPHIFHIGWRNEQDNLWSMGPLENLVGMQYRLDHLENLKADAMDLTTFPLIKVKGFVEEFTWEPRKKILMGEDGDVELLFPNQEILKVNSELMNLEAKMEEMAGAPKEALGFRTPGEKTAFEVQRLENAASRIFNVKIKKFEEFLEKVLNACLEIGKRNFGSASLRVFDDEFKVNSFREISVDDINGSGKLRPMGARHFAEKAELIQNMNNLFSSPIGQSEKLMMHTSGLQLTKMIEEMLSVEDFQLFKPYVHLMEAAEGQRLQQTLAEQVQTEGLTPAGVSEDDAEGDFALPPEEGGSQEDLINMLSQQEGGEPETDDNGVPLNIGEEQGFDEDEE